MTQKMSYDEVSDVFFSNKIWNSDNEFRWYQWCWEMLDNHGLTKYSTGYEKALVYVRAYTLHFIYAELCNYLANEYFNYEVPPDEDFLPEALLGYALARTDIPMSAEYDLYGMTNIEMLELCVDSQRLTVSNALTDTYNNQPALMIFKYATFDEIIYEEMDEFFSNLSLEEENALGWLNMGAHQRGLLEF